MTCPTCGAGVRGGLAFCTQCGAALPAPAPSSVLEIVDGPQAGRTVEVAAVLDVGRGAGAGLVLDDEFVSRSHARLARRGEDLYVEDLGTKNGTFVNGTRIAEAMRLVPGDEVLIGETRLVVRT